MTPFVRRALLAAGLFALSGAAFAADQTKLIELKKVFPYLDAYYALPPAARSKFQISYAFQPKGGALSAMKAAYVGADGRTPLQLGEDGRVLRLPTPAMLKDGHKFEVTKPETVKMGVRLNIEPTARAAAEIDARELAAAVRQAAEGVRKSAGVMRFAAPKMERVVFQGGQGGVMVTQAGRSTPLAVVKGVPVFDPAAAPDARWIRFTRAPSGMTIGPAK
jgi:hypothetical protein